MKVFTLTGALLDYWVARAEGIPAEQLSIVPVPRTDTFICVWSKSPVGFTSYRDKSVYYSDDWAQGGPLIEKHGGALINFTDEGAEVWGCFMRGKSAGHYIDTYLDDADGVGDTPLQAVCRAVVRAAFGDDVEELPC